MKARRRTRSGEKSEVPRSLSGPWRITHYPPLIPLLLHLRNPGILPENGGEARCRAPGANDFCVRPHPLISIQGRPLLLIPDRSPSASPLTVFRLPSSGNPHAAAHIPLVSALFGLLSGQPRTLSIGTPFECRTNQQFRSSVPAFGIEPIRLKESYRRCIVFPSLSEDL